MDNGINKFDVRLFEAYFFMPEKLYGLRFTFERDDKDVGRVFSVRGERMNLVGLMKQQLALFQNQRLPVGGTEDILLVRIDKLPKSCASTLDLKFLSNSK